MVSWSSKLASLSSVFLLTLSVLFLPSCLSYRLGKRASAVQRRSPVILVPGDGGSQLEAKLNKPTTAHYYCNKKTDDFFNLWLNLELLFPYVLECWVDNIRLEYNNVTRKTSNSPGVEIRIPGFGNTASVEWLDPSQISPSAYFFSIVDTLVSIGYTRGSDIKGAPYDYRKAPNELTDYYSALKSMSEETYKSNNNTPITYICHSMGCPVMLYFFNHQTRQWKDTHVKALVSLGGAWGGAVKALKAYASGENLGVYVINHLSVRREQRTCPSLAYMTPSDILWNTTQVLVETPTKNYSLANLYDFFQDIGFPDGWEMRKDTYNLTRMLIPPEVEIHCMHGVGEQTIDKLVYGKGEFPDGSPTLSYGDGDGTVNIRSLESCLRFQGQQKHKIFHVPLKNVDHMGILAEAKVLDYVKTVVTSF